MTSPIDESYVQEVVRELRRLRKLAEKAMAQLSDKQYFATFGAEDNSAAVIVKHMAGNMKSRWRDFMTADGEKPDRDRDGEFEIRDGDTRERLMQQWQEGWESVFRELEPLQVADLGRTVTIRGEPFTVLQAINRHLPHYAYHVGQIVYVAKQQVGSAWKSLSIPRGKSGDFNRHPENYLPKS